MSETKKLLIATKNAHKTGEIRAMLGGDWEVSDLTSQPEFSSPEETGTTFRENAAIKALALAQRFDGLVLADDSGLEVDALGGAPGVYSARYAGAEASDADNRKKLVGELDRLGLTSSPARFHCALVLAHGGDLVAHFDGIVEGTIIHEEQGAGGFGYDALFIPAGKEKTFGELPAAEKNAMSHRANAMMQFLNWLNRQPVITGPRCKGWESRLLRHA